MKSYVVDRHGKQVSVKFDMITERNEELCTRNMYGPPLSIIDCPLVTAEVVKRFRNGMTTREIDEETAMICMQMASYHSNYESLTARIYVSDLHKRTPDGLYDTLSQIMNLAQTQSRGIFRISNEMIEIAKRGSVLIDAAIQKDRDYRFKFFGYQTLARSYLLRPVVRVKDSTLSDEYMCERPQHLYMRVALGIFVCTPDGDGHLATDEIFAARLQDAIYYYSYLSLQKVSNATPTMLNAGTCTQQLSSCFQIATGDDLSELLDTIKSAGLISKWSGGISLWLHNVRAEGSVIKKTGGVTSGIKRYVKILNELQLYVDQGGNRPGAMAVYLGVDHADIITFLTMPRLKGEEATRSLNAPELKYAMWVSDLFMETLSEQMEGKRTTFDDGKEPGTWYIFSPDTAPDLHLTYGDEYKLLYKQYVDEKRYVKEIKAGDIIQEAFKTWAQVGIPYVLYKDSINKKSNMKNVAPICSSNLCVEILIPSWSKYDKELFSKYHKDNAKGGEFGVCNLAAICLESYITEKNDIDYGAIIESAKLETRAMNNVIDLNYYPTEECRRSNQRHRPIGIGIMGLADVFARLNLWYGSKESIDIAKGIAACIYFGAAYESCALSKISGAYDSFEGSPISKGILQPDMWHKNGWEHEIEKITNGVIGVKDWEVLRQDIMKYGIRNAYLTAYMPTATTSNVVGQSECFEPFTSNIYIRRTLAGEFIIVNKHLINLLIEKGVWNDKMRKKIISNGGSISNIDEIPKDIQKVYKTSREIHSTYIIQMCSAMSPFVCQSLSMNLFLKEPKLPKILRFLFEGWKAGLKTGLYYCHTSPIVGSQKTSIRENIDPKKEDELVCTSKDCSSCSI